MHESPAVTAEKSCTCWNLKWSAADLRYKASIGASHRLTFLGRRRHWGCQPRRRGALYCQAYHPTKRCSDQNYWSLEGPLSRYRSSENQPYLFTSTTKSKIGPARSIRLNQKGATTARKLAKRLDNPNFARPRQAAELAESLRRMVFGKPYGACYYPCSSLGLIDDELRLYILYAR
jgi:hypothetical protein